MNRRGAIRFAIILALFLVLLSVVYLASAVKPVENKDLPKIKQVTQENETNLSMPKANNVDIVEYNVEIKSKYSKLASFDFKKGKNDLVLYEPSRIKSFFGKAIRFISNSNEAYYMETSMPEGVTASEIISLNPNIETISFYDEETENTIGFVNLNEGIGTNFEILPGVDYEIIVSDNSSIVIPEGGPE